jgi:hypothetical protein
MKEDSSKKKAIAIVGSIEEGRIYDPRLEHIDEAKKAAELLGTSLGARGYRIIVYSAEREFIESDVVRGFVKSSKGQKELIVVHYPTGQRGPEGFAEYLKHSEMFEPQRLSKADGVVLFGGGRSTLIAGVVALTYRVPLIALARYGGHALTVWRAIERGKDLPAERDVQDMAREGSPEMVKQWIRSLETQFDTRQTEKTKRQPAWSAIAALLLLAAWVAILPLGYWLRRPDTKPDTPVPLLFVILLFAAPMLSGASGATVRSLLPGNEMSLNTAVKGTAAGVISALLNLLAQLIGNPTPSFVVLVSTLIFGFIAGFSFDQVFKKLESAESIQTKALKKFGEGGDS